MNRGGDALEPDLMPRALEGFEYINRYWDRTNDCFAAKILPGEFYVTRNDELITTVLGSCISACIRDREAGIGGMNHFMLPHDASGTGSWSGADPFSASTRYGSFAMERLINEIIKYGGKRERLEVKVFGGGKVLAQMTDVGERNIEFVHQYLDAERIAVTAENTGDIFPRKVIYFPRTGRVLMKKLKTLQNETVIEREKRYLRTIETQPVQGEVDLF